MFDLHPFVAKLNALLALSRRVRVEVGSFSATTNGVVVTKREKRLSTTNSYYTPDATSEKNLAGHPEGDRTRKHTFPPLSHGGFVR